MAPYSGPGYTYEQYKHIHINMGNARTSTSEDDCYNTRIHVIFQAKEDFGHVSKIKTK